MNELISHSINGGLAFITVCIGAYLFWYLFVRGKEPKDEPDDTERPFW